jgi:hypothetical protein
MILKPLLPAILLALVMSVFVGVLATGRGSGLTMGLAAGLYILQVGFAIARINAPFWSAGATGVEDDLAVACVWSNAVLAALVYAWGATAMFAIYSLSGLYWRHWWEYGAGMSLIAGGILLYAYYLGSGRTTLHTRALQILIGLTALQGAVMGGAFIYLLLSGKLQTPRDDWAANYIFTAGTLILVVLSAVAILTYRNIGRSRVARVAGG